MKVGAIKSTGMLLTTYILFTLLSCVANESNSYFQIESGTTELQAPKEGIVQEYYVKSNGSWQIVHKGIGTWTKASPREGENDGSFQIIVDENKTAQARTLKLGVLLNGKDYPVSISIEQAGQASTEPDTEDYPIKYNSFRVRDPFIFADPISQKYYLHSYAADALYPSAPNQIGCVISKDLINWRKGGISFKAPANFWGKTDFWAPDEYYYEGKYYMFATFSSVTGIRGASILVSEKPEGPFRPLVNQPITPNDWMALDAALYVDENKDPWIIYSHEWTQISDGTIVAQKLTKDLKMPAEPPVTLFGASEASWIMRRSFYVSDAPFLYKASNGDLLMLWSSFGEGDMYCIGVSRSRSGNILGPWTHDPNPLNMNDNGGHAMVFRDFSGRLKISYHSPNTPGGSERLTIHPLLDNNGNLSIDFSQ